MRRALFAIPLTLLTAAIASPAVASGCELIRGNQFLRQAYCPADTSKGEIRSFSKAMCGDDNGCNVWIWNSRDKLPKKLLMTDAEVNRAHYVWVNSSRRFNVCAGKQC